MFVKSFFPFNSSLLKPRWRTLKGFAPPSYISQGATAPQQNYCLFLKTWNGVFHLPLSETLLFLIESTYPQKHIQVLKPARKHRGKGWNSSKQQGLTWFITINLHKHWVISETLRKGCYRIIKYIICLFPEFPVGMEILTGIHSLEISHPDDPYSQQVARRGFYLERNSKKGFWISFWWEKKIKCAN